jgi:hypothetical protein
VPVALQNAAENALVFSIRARLLIRIKEATSWAKTRASEVVVQMCGVLGNVEICKGLEPHPLFSRLSRMGFDGRRKREK